MPASQNTWRVWVTSSSWVDSESNSYLSEIEPNWSSLGSGPRPAQVDTFGPDCDRGVLTCLKNCMWKHPMNFRGRGTRESTQESIRQIDKAAGNQMIATELKIRMKTRLISVTHLKKPISTTITYITYLQRQDTDWHTHVSLHLSFSDRQVRIPCRRKSDSDIFAESLFDVSLSGGHELIHTPFILDRKTGERWYRKCHSGLQ